MNSHYKIKWHMAIFSAENCNGLEWIKFKRKYKKTFVLNNLIDKNKITMWYLHPERIDWIKENLPKGMCVHFFSITDKQFEDSLIFWGEK